MFDRDVSLFGRKRPIPEYYDTMYMDGYEPWEIMEAAHKRMLRMVKEREAEKNRVDEIKITSVSSWYATIAESRHGGDEPCQTSEK